MNNSMSQQKQRPRSITWSATVGLTTFVACMLMLQASGQEQVAPRETLSSRDVQLQFAKTSLELAKVELCQADKYNRDLAKSVESRVTLDEAGKSRMLTARQLPSATIERLKSNVAVAEEQLKQVKLASTEGSERVLLLYTEEKVRLAKIRLELAQASKVGDSENREMNVERAQLIHELARLRLTMLTNPGYLSGAMEALYLKTDRLSEDHVALEQRIAALEDISVR